jgi:phytoene synthase
MLRIYGGLLDEIERRDYDVITRRVSLPRWRKLAIAVAATVRYRWLRRGDDDLAPLPPDERKQAAGRISK